MGLRWCAAGMAETSKRFRRVNGFMHLPALRKALEKTSAEHATPIDYDNEDAA
jgi:putative transposase